MVVVTKGKFLHKQRMKFRRKWAEYDTTSSSSSNSEEDEDDQEIEDKNTGEDEEEEPEQAGKKLIEEVNELGEEGNEEDEEDETNEKKACDWSEQEVEEEKVTRAWYHWSNERGPTANQDYQREIEERGLQFLLETLDGGGGRGAHSDTVSYQHGGVYGRLEQVRTMLIQLLLF